MKLQETRVQRREIRKSKLRNAEYLRQVHQKRQLSKSEFRSPEELQKDTKLKRPSAGKIIARNKKEESKDLPKSAKKVSN